MSKTLTIGTRNSKLARWQTDHISQQLQLSWPDLTCQIKPFVPKGDKILTQPLPQIGGKGLFTAELEQALLHSEIDLAVHSLKDLPVENRPNIIIGAITTRADVRDVLISRHPDWRLGRLPLSARVGTSSHRRRAQLLAARPDLDVVSIRGNVDTRIRKLQAGNYEAIVLAAAGITRLALEQHITQWLPLSVMMPAPGQAALAVQCRADDAETRRLLNAIDDKASRACVTAERAFLDHLGGGCSLPVGAYAEWGDGMLTIRGLVASVTGDPLLFVEATGHEPTQLGKALAQMALAKGAKELLANVQ